MQLNIKIKIKKDDRVIVLLGKDRGKEGKVMKILSRKNQAFVEGINLHKRHIRKMGNIEGGIIDLPKPVDISNLALICPRCKKATRIGFVSEQGRKLRICKKCKEAIDDKVKK